MPTGTVGTGDRSGFQTTGRMVRVMMFQSGVMWIGITGCVENLLRPSVRADAEIRVALERKAERSPIGFWIFFARSVAL